MRAHSRSPPNPKMEKQNKETNVNKSSVFLQQMEVLKRNRDALAKRNIKSVSNLSVNNDRPKKVRRLNEDSGCNTKSPNYQRISNTKDTKANNPKLQQKSSFCNEMIDHGETFYEHLKKVHGPKKPDGEFKRPFTDSRGDNLKSIVEEVHGRKKSDGEIKSPYTNSRGDNLRSHVEEDTIANSSALQQKCPVCNKMISHGENLISHIDKVHGRNRPDREIKRPYTDGRGENLESKVEEAHGSKKPDSEAKTPYTTDSRGENLKSKVEEAHGSKKPDGEIIRPHTDSLVGNFKSHIEQVRGMKKSVPLNNEGKSPVHEEKKPGGRDEIPTSEEKTQYSEESGEISEVGDDEIPDFENEPERTTFRGNLKSNIEKVYGSEKPKGPMPIKKDGKKYEPNNSRELTLTQLTEIETKGQQLLALVGDLDPNNERRIIFKSRFEDLLRPYKEELRQKTDKMFSMAE